MISEIIYNAYRFVTTLIAKRRDFLEKEKEILNEVINRVENRGVRWTESEILDNDSAFFRNLYKKSHRYFKSKESLQVLSEIQFSLECARILTFTYRSKNLDELLAEISRNDIIKRAPRSIGMSKSKQIPSQKNTSLSKCTEQAAYDMIIEYKLLNRNASIDDVNEWVNRSCLENVYNLNLISIDLSRFFSQGFIGRVLYKRIGDIEI
jgi:hypothetical protein